MFSTLMAIILQKIWSEIWPQFDDEPDDPTKIDLSHIKEQLENVTDSDTLKSLYSLSESLSLKEKERLDSTIRRSVTLLSATGIMSAIFLVITNLKSAYTSNNILIKLLFVVFFIYIGRTVWFCLDTLKPRIYWRIGVDEIIKDINLDSNIFTRNRTMELLEYIERNGIVINNCIDSFILARLYFRNAIFTLLLIGIILIFK